VSITNQRIAVNHSKKLVDSELGRQQESRIEIIVVEDGSISADSSFPVCKFSYHRCEKILKREFANRERGVGRDRTILYDNYLYP